MGTISILDDINTLWDRLEANKEATVNARLHRIDELKNKKYSLSKAREVSLENIKLTEIQIGDLSKDLDIRNSQYDRLSQAVDTLQIECNKLTDRINTVRNDIDELKIKFQDESNLYRLFLGLEVHLSNSDRVVIRLSHFDHLSENNNMTIIAIKEVSSDALGLLVDGADPCIIGFDKLADNVNNRTITLTQFIATCRNLFTQRLLHKANQR